VKPLQKIIKSAAPPSFANIKVEVNKKIELKPVLKKAKTPDPAPLSLNQIAE
jgi:hypothetical protein